MEFHFLLKVKYNKKVWYVKHARQQKSKILVTIQVVRFTVQRFPIKSGLAILRWPLCTLYLWRHRVRLPCLPSFGQGLIPPGNRLRRSRWLSCPPDLWRAGLDFGARSLSVSQEPDELRISLGIQAFENISLFNPWPRPGLAVLFI